MNFLKSTKQSLIVEYGFHAPSYNFLLNKGLNDKYGVVTLILRKTFWKDLDDQIFLCILNYGVFPIKSFL